MTDDHGSWDYCIILYTLMTIDLIVKVCNLSELNKLYLYLYHPCDFKNNAA